MIIKLAYKKQIKRLEDQSAKNDKKIMALHSEYEREKKNLGLNDGDGANRAALIGGSVGLGLSVGGHLLFKKKPTFNSIVGSALVTGGAAFGSGVHTAAKTMRKNREEIEIRNPKFVEKYNKKLDKLYDKRNKINKSYTKIPESAIDEYYGD